MVRALRDARERLRDAAAATHSNATAACDESRAELEASHDRLEAFLDDAADELASVRNVHDIDLLHAITGSHRLAVADAASRHAQAIAITEVTAGDLRTRARQLRTAEKLVELVGSQRDSREARAEQRASDDMSSRRR
jgi:flagellar biosynthesis chaperone FliJ